MSIKIKISKLMNMIKSISNIIKNKKTENILSYILIKVIKKKIFCVAINEEIEIVTYNIYDNYITDLEILVKCDLIYEICKRSNEESDIVIKKYRNLIEINIDDAHYQLPNALSEKFPSFNDENEIITKFKITSYSLNNLLSSVLISLSENNIQEFLNGVYLEINENFITTFSSDGERFTFAYDYLEEKNKNINIIIPKQTVNEVINLIEKSKHIHVTITKKYAKFITENITLTSKLINNSYHMPNLNINQDYIVKTTMDKKKIKKSIYKINFLIKENKISFDLSENNVKIYTELNNEKATISFKNEIFINENINVNLNNKYLSDILRYITNDNLNLIFSKKKKFVIIKEEKFNYMYTLIPF